MTALSRLSSPASAIGIVSLLRRIFCADLRQLSVADDYVSLGLTLLFMAGAWCYALGLLPPLALDIATVALMIYLPLSKIRHMLMFFITRYHHGEHFGALGIYARSAKAPERYDPEQLKRATAEAAVADAKQPDGHQHR